MQATIFCSGERLQPCDARRHRQEEALAMCANLLLGADDEVLEDGCTLGPAPEEQERAKQCLARKLPEACLCSNVLRGSLCFLNGVDRSGCSVRPSEVVSLQEGAGRGAAVLGN